MMPKLKQNVLYGSKAESPDIDSGVTRERHGLQLLAKGDIPYLKFKNVLTTTEAKDIAKAVGEIKRLKSYSHIRGMKKIGYAYSEIRNNDDVKEYLKWGVTINTVLNSFLPFDPIQRIHKWLESNWPGGIRKAALKKFDFPAGILRHHEQGWCGEVAHLDFAPPVVLQQAGMSETIQWGVVLYAQAPENGGNLKIWTDRRYTSSEYDEIYRTKNSALELHNLGTPSHDISIERGDLVIFPTHFPHSVGMINSGARISFGFFALASSFDRPLIIWS